MAGVGTSNVGGVNNTETNIAVHLDNSVNDTININGYHGLIVPDVNSAEKDDSCLPVHVSAIADLEELNKIPAAGAGSSSHCGSLNQLDSSPHLWLLPSVVTREVLKNIPSSDQQSVLNCRLVCKDWNFMIIYSPESMKKIKFPIRHPKPFLDLEIVKNGKVKWVSFRIPLQESDEHEYTQQLLDLLSTTVEKVEFAYEGVGSPITSLVRAELKKQLDFFKLILERFTNVQELNFKICSKDWFLGGKRPAPMPMPAQTSIPALNKITRISVEHKDVFSDPHVVVLFTMLMTNVPNLEELQLIGKCASSDAYIRIIKALSAYMKKYPGQLKKLSFGRLTKGLPDLSVLDHAIFTWFSIICGKNKIQLDHPPEITINSLLALTFTNPKERAELLLNNRPIFPMKIDAKVIFDGPKLTNLDRLDSLNVGKLNVVFKRDLMNGELSWIKKLHRTGIENLVLDNSQRELFNVVLGRTAIIEFEEALSAGLPTLKKLYIKNDLFDSIRIFWWDKYFPNLTELCIDNCEVTPNYLISELTKLESLIHLTLTDLPNLTDAAFTAEVQSRFAAISGRSMVPTIASFKSLKYLDILACSELTEECVINGISKSATLKKLTIHYCDKMTENCRGMLECCEVDFRPGLSIAAFARKYAI